jgi:glycosyltransferase involved in cell wall biosynthesis
VNVLSVALCTYNGAKFIREQLESIATQSRLPDELIICDDDSHDSTLDLVKRFAAAAPFTVRVHANPRNLGSTKNFEQAVSMCRGDIIVLSDQDDVWRQDKLFQMETFLAAAPEMAAVFSDAEMVDADLHPLGYRLWQSLRLTRFQQNRIRNGAAIEVLLKCNVVTGATLAFRSQFRTQLLPIPDDWVHDGWIALLLASTARLGVIAEPLLLYRQHASNQLGALRKGVVEKLEDLQRRDRGIFSTYRNQCLEAKSRLLQIGVASTAPVIRMLDDKVNHLEWRGSLPTLRPLRLPGILHELVNWRYFRYSNGGQSAALDFIS